MKVILDSPGLYATDMLDEHLLHETVRFAIVLVVVPLAQLANLGQLRISEGATAVAERLERILGLA